MKTKSSDRVLRILFVDDCPDTISAMQTLCTLLGFDSLGVKNGLAALDVARQYRPHIMIMDISMPHLDGYEAARRIRDQKHAGDVILVAMTGWGGEAYEEKAREAGFDHFWLKPVNFDVMRMLFATVQNQLHETLPATSYARETVGQS